MASKACSSGAGLVRQVRPCVSLPARGLYPSIHNQFGQLGRGRQSHRGCGVPLTLLTYLVMVRFLTEGQLKVQWQVECENSCCIIPLVPCQLRSEGTNIPVSCY